MPNYEYHPTDGYNLGYWEVFDPTIDDMIDFVLINPRRKWYNFIVVGQPCEISPQWLAKHPDYVEGEYDYAVSYSIYTDDLDMMLEEETVESVLDAFNWYLEGTGKCWKSIDSIRLVDRKDPWEGAQFQ